MSGAAKGFKIRLHNRRIGLYRWGDDGWILTFKTLFPDEPDPANVVTTRTHQRVRSGAVVTETQIGLSDEALQALIDLYRYSRSVMSDKSENLDDFFADLDR